MARYTDADKRKAVDLYLTEGAEAAADAIGCDRRTIYKWLARHSVPTKNNEDTRAETALRHAQEREQLRQILADKAIELALALHPAANELKAVATAMGISIDKLLLLSGEATSRTDVLAPIDRELQKVIDEFSRQHT